MILWIYNCGRKTKRCQGHWCCEKSISCIISYLRYPAVGSPFAVEALGPAIASLASVLTKDDWKTCLSHFGLRLLSKHWVHSGFASKCEDERQLENVPESVGSPFGVEALGSIAAPLASVSTKDDWKTCLSQLGLSLLSKYWGPQLLRWQVCRLKTIGKRAWVIWVSVCCRSIGIHSCSFGKCVWLKIIGKYFKNPATNQLRQYLIQERSKLGNK